MLAILIFLAIWLYAWGAIMFLINSPHPWLAPFWPVVLPLVMIAGAIRSIPL